MLNIPQSIQQFHSKRSYSPDTLCTISYVEECLLQYCLYLESRHSLSVNQSICWIREWVHKILQQPCHRIFCSHVLHVLIGKVFKIRLLRKNATWCAEHSHTRHIKCGTCLPYYRKVLASGETCCLSEESWRSKVLLVEDLSFTVHPFTFSLVLIFL
jgi:hypothetical protein